MRLPHADHPLSDPAIKGSFGHRPPAKSMAEEGRELPSAGCPRELVFKSNFAVFLPYARKIVNGFSSNYLVVPYVFGATYGKNTQGRGAQHQERTGEAPGSTRAVLAIAIGRARNRLPERCQRRHLDRASLLLRARPALPGARHRR